MENYSLIDLHVHSHLSDGLNSPLELAFRAKKIGLNGIAIVDHAPSKNFSQIISNRFKAYEIASKKSKLLVIPGIEFSLNDGHIVTLFPSYNFNLNINDNLSLIELSEKIRAIGGIIIAAHIFRKSGLKLKVMDYKKYLDAIEIYPLKSKFKSIINSINLPLVAGSDAHTKYTLGFAITKISFKTNSIVDIIYGIKHGYTAPIIRKSFLLRKLIDFHRFINPRFIKSARSVFSYFAECFW